MRKMATKTGLTTTVHVIKKLSQTQRKATDAFGEDLPIEFDSILPRWTTRPSQGLALDGGNEIIVVGDQTKASFIMVGAPTNNDYLICQLRKLFFLKP